MIQKIRGIILAHPEAKRAELARILCREFKFYSPTGKARAQTLADILKRMGMDNLIRLPKTAPQKTYRKKKPSLPTLLEYQEKRSWTTRDIHPIKFTLIRKPSQQRLWNVMMGEYHYLKSPKLFGSQLRYLISSANLSAAA